MRTAGRPSSSWPMMISRTIVKNMNSAGESPSLDIRSLICCDTPARARVCASGAAAAMMKNTIPAVVVVSRRVSPNSFLLPRR